MAKTYNSIPTVSTGDVYTATAHNNIVTNVNNYRVPPACMVRRTTNVNPYTSSTAISWSDAAYDTDSMFSAGSATRVTINTAGIYIATFFTSVSGTATMTLVDPYISLNGTIVAEQYTPVYNGTAAYSTATFIGSLAVNDYLTATVSIVGGSAYIVNGSSTIGNTQSRLVVQWLGQVS